MSTFDKYAATLHERLKASVATGPAGGELPMQAALDAWRSITEAARRQDRAHYFVGNGASATMASHMALDCSKNAGIRGLAFNDAAYLTAIGNDLGGDQTFAAPLRWHARAGDVLVAISSSGRSPNIVAAISAAREKGCSIITLTGMGADNPSRKLGDLNFYVPGRTYGCVESLHQVILHCWLDQCMGISECGPGTG
jgi:D-sedoheptulose 7-phosphate isomerase